MKHAARRRRAGDHKGRPYVHLRGGTLASFGEAVGPEIEEVGRLPLPPSHGNLLFLVGVAHRPQQVIVAEEIIDLDYV